MEFVKNRQSFLQSYKYILLTEREGRTGRISARGLDSTDLAALGPYRKDRGPIFSQYGPEQAWLIRDLILFAGWEVRIVKNCDQGLENAARGRRPRAAFSRPRSQFFTIRTDPKPANNSFIFFLR